MMYRNLLMLLFSLVGLCLHAQDFPFRLFSTVDAKEKTNIVISPLSGQLAISMLVEGTSGKAQRQLLDVMGYSTDADAQNAGRTWMNTLPGLDGSVVFEPANSVWTNTGIRVKEAFRQTLQDAYRAEVLHADLTTAEGLKQLDGWVSDKTHGRIPSLDIQANPDMWLVLVNTLYLKAPFTYCFNESYTKPGTFHNADGSKVGVQMMHQFEHFSYAHMEEYGFDVVEMPLGEEGFYDEKKQNYSMAFFLPLEGQSSLSEDVWTHYQEALERNVYVELSLPKFSIGYEMNMREILSEMGVTDIFDGADLSRISDDAMGVSQMRQKSVLGIDEQGVEGASATYVEVNSGLPGQKCSMTFDRPFYFAVRERTTGAVLFMGHVVALEGTDGISTPTLQKTPSARFGLDGRRSDNTSHGIVIEDGKKVLR